MILSHSYRFIFICSSKVGTTSMEQILQPFQEGAEYDFGIQGLFPAKHVPAAMLRAALPESVWRDYFKFVFVRNPWDWFVSQWFYNRPSQGEHFREPVAAARLPRAPTWRGQRRKAALQPDVPDAAGSDRHPTDPEVLDRSQVDALFQLLVPFRGLPGREGCYQSNWMYDMNGELIVDYIGRYETLDYDFAEICRRIGINVQLPHLNRTVHRDYRSYYTDASRTRVEELWEVDVANFRYTFDGPCSDHLGSVR